MSILQIELDAETENRLERLSRQEGNAMGDVASCLLAHAARTYRPAAEITEVELLQKINEGTIEEITEQLRGNNLTGKLKVIVTSADDEATAINGTGETLDTALSALLEEADRIERTTPVPPTDLQEKAFGEIIDEKYRKMGFHLVRRQSSLRSGRYRTGSYVVSWSALEECANLNHTAAYRTFFRKQTFYWRVMTAHLHCHNVGEVMWEVEPYQRHWKALPLHA